MNGIMAVRFTADGFRVFYALLAAFLWLMTGLFSIQYFKGHSHKGRYICFTVLTFFAVEGVFFAADLLTLFLFFEMMSFTSYVWVVQEETVAAVRASKTYLAVAVIGGLSMLMGLFMLQHAFGSLTISELQSHAERFLNGEGGNFGNRRTYLYTAAALLTAGFAGKAGVFPLHIWLPKAHPAAPAPASALLSGMLTKCGIFGMLLVNCYLLSGDAAWGRVIFVLGLVTMLIGAVSALFSVDIKRILACSSVSQIGFITLGIGMVSIAGGEGPALYGTVYHMVNHSLLKLVLFMAAGVVYIHTHSLDLNRVRGFGRKHPVLGATVLSGVLGLAGIPGLNGYISKTLLHESIVEQIAHLEAEGAASGLSLFRTAEVLFLVAGGLTLAYMLKLFIAIFVERGEGEQHTAAKSMTPLSGIAVCGPAVLLPVLGLTPDRIFAEIGGVAEAFFNPYSGKKGVKLSGIAWLSAENLKGAAISAAIGILVYVVVVRLLLMKKENGQRVYVNRVPSWLDLEDAVYRPVLLYFLPFVCAFFCRLCDRLVDGAAALLNHTVLAPRKKRLSVWVGTRLTHMLGTAMDMLVLLLNKTLFHKHPIKKSFVSVFAVSELEARQTFSLITGSVSFGLLLAATGLAITLLYLLF